MIGVCEYADFKKILVADVPGLIDGAHLNVGLGHYFLRHIERTKLLLYVIDMGGVDGRKPIDDYRILKNELEEYMEGLSDRAMLIIANKMDLPESQENYEEFVLALEDDIDIFPMSAGTDEDFTEIKEKIRELVSNADRRDEEANWRRNIR